MLVQDGQPRLSLEGDAVVRVVDGGQRWGLSNVQLAAQTLAPDGHRRGGVADQDALLTLNEGETVGTVFFLL